MTDLKQDFWSVPAKNILESLDTNKDGSSDKGYSIKR